jgi:hypothetical protein
MSTALGSLPASAGPTSGVRPAPRTVTFRRTFTLPAVADPGALFTALRLQLTHREGKGPKSLGCWPWALCAWVLARGVVRLLLLMLLRLLLWWWWWRWLLLLLSLALWGSSGRPWSPVRCCWVTAGHHGMLCVLCWACACTLCARAFAGPWVWVLSVAVCRERSTAHSPSVPPPLSFRPLGVLAATTVSLNGRPIAVTAASVAPSATSRIPLLQELIVRDAGPFLVPGVNVVTVEVWAAVSRVSSLFDLRMDLVSLRRVWCRRPSTPRLPYAHVLHVAVDAAARHICVCCVAVWMGFTDCCDFQ